MIEIKVFGKTHCPLCEERLDPYATYPFNRQGSFDCFWHCICIEKVANWFRNSMFPRSSKTNKGGTGQNLIRRLTPLECERLQGFPDNWTEGVSDTRRYNQCGNAVTVNVVEQIIQRMLNREVKSGCDANDDGIPPNNKVSVNTNI